MITTFIRIEKKAASTSQCDMKSEEKSSRKRRLAGQDGIWLVYAIGMTMVLLQLRSLM